MRFQTDLIPGTLIRRYKRFFADCQLDDGREVTAHIANTGPMTGLVEPGTRVWLEPSDNPKRKLKFSWKLAEFDGGVFVGVDTGAANTIVGAALEAGQIAAFAGAQVRREARYGEKSRVDFLLSFADGPDLYLEVKSVTLLRQAGLAEFPDTVTTRGAKHMGELAQMRAEGHRAGILYLAQRNDCQRFAVAADIDPAYAEAAARAKAAGLETYVFDTDIGPQGITLNAAQPLPVQDALES